MPEGEGPSRGERPTHPRSWAYLVDCVKKLAQNPFSSAPWNDATPPWHSTVWAGKYEGPEDWWADYKYKDPVREKGRIRHIRPMIPEDDTRFYDPPVENSPFGLDGQDMYRDSAQFSKYDTLEWTPREEWLEDVYHKHPQIMAIEKKYDISPQHPGMKLVPYLASENVYRPKWQLGMDHEAAERGGYRILGPRFTDAPMGQQCLVKTLWCAKAAGIVCLPLSIDKAADPFEPFPRGRPNIRFYAKAYARYAARPVAMAMAWGASTCLASSVRGEDDWRNYFFGGAAVGVLRGAFQHSWRDGFVLGAVVTFGGLFFHLLRYSEHGIAGPSRIPYWNWSPLEHQYWFDFGRQRAYTPQERGERDF